MTTHRPTEPGGKACARPVYDSDLRPHPFIEEFLELFRYRDLVYQWSLRNIKVRYKRSALGVLWTLLEPLMIMGILTVVFSTGFRVAIHDYPVYILIGLSFWDFFRRSTIKMMDEIIASENLAKRIYIPRSAFTVAAILTYMISWLITFIPLFIIMLILRHPFSWTLVTVPAGMLLVALFTLGVGLIVATMAAFFHDVSLMYQVILTAWLYATPIIYPIDIVPERFRRFLMFNPVTPLLETVRSPIYNGHAAQPGIWIASTGIALGTISIGWWVFTHWRDAFDYRI